MRDLVVGWYGILNTLYVIAKGPLAGLALGTEGPLLTAVLLGILGAASPCQLSTNASSTAYILHGAGEPNWAPGRSALAYLAGKVLTYSGIGLLAVLMGEALQAAAIPTVVVVRKVLGPTMILISLAMLGIWRPRLGFGHRLGSRLKARVGTSGPRGAFLLGVGFSFAFCPTLALLFFGYVIPITVTSAAGPFLPAAFALGTTFPLVVAALALTAGTDAAGLTRRLPSWGPWLRRIAGGVFLLSGISDTLLYWFL